MPDQRGHSVSPARAWRSADFSRESDWVTRFSSQEIDQLRAVAQSLPAASQDWLNVDLADQLHGALGERIAASSRDLAAGKGFVLLRGLPAEDPELLRRMFWVVANGLGRPVMQNARGEVLSEVTDRFAGAERGVDTRGYESNDELRFHCDGGDCIGMSCLRQAQAGADNGLVSLLAIYNEILANHPAALEVLERGYALYARKEKGDAQSTSNLGKVQEGRIPVFAWQDGRMSAWVNLKLAELAAEMSGQPMSVQESEALKLVETIAEREDFKLTFRQQPGDVLWVSNHAVMHRRDRYEDEPEPERRRLLYRMWINLHAEQSVVAPHAALRRGIRGPAPVVGAQQPALVMAAAGG